MICVVLAFCAAAAITSPAQSAFFTDLVNFDQTNGNRPLAALVQATDGNFYGTTANGGDNQSCYGCGTVFKITPSGTLATLHSFDGSDGAVPYAGLVQGADGNFYSTTAGGGAYQYGTVFKITPSGTLTTLHSFDGSDGTGPVASLVQGADGNFYSTTAYGGDYQWCGYGCGTVFKITSEGQLTTLHRFNGLSDGQGPGALMQASDGNFYGVGFESNFGYGMIFKMSPGGVLTRLYTFCRQPNCTDGIGPNGLIQASDGNLYGTTLGGGNDNCQGGCGTVFKITLAGTLTTLYRFCASGPPCPDGGRPYNALLLQASDGNLYGTTSSGLTDGCGVTGCGTVFKITLVGGLTTLHTFDLTHGADPEAGLVQATDGNFYGTTFIGGDLSACDPGGCGTVFRVGVARSCATCRP